MGEGGDRQEWAIEVAGDGTEIVVACGAGDAMFAYHRPAASPSFARVRASPSACAAPRAVRDLDGFVHVVAIEDDGLLHATHTASWHREATVLTWGEGQGRAADLAIDEAGGRSRMAGRSGGGQVAVARRMGAATTWDAHELPEPEDPHRRALSIAARAGDVEVAAGYDCRRTRWTAETGWTSGPTLRDGDAADAAGFGAPSPTCLLRATEGGYWVAHVDPDPDGLRFGDGYLTVFHVDPTSGTVTSKRRIPTRLETPFDIEAGPSGEVWFAYHVSVMPPGEEHPLLQLRVARLPRPS